MNKTQNVLQGVSYKPTIVNLPVYPWVSLWARNSVRVRTKGGDTVFTVSPVMPPEVPESEEQRLTPEEYLSLYCRTMYPEPEPRDVTTAFLRVTDISEAVDFFTRYGYLGTFRDMDGVAGDPRKPKNISWRDFLSVQERIRHCWTSPVSEWNIDSAELGVPFNTDFRNKDQPCLFVVCDCVTSILVIDLIFSTLGGQKHGFCARPDCGALFQKTSAHERKYCSPECAHVESVRRFRTAKQKPKSKKARR